VRKLILRSRLSPGDIVMLTAAVRDLHRAHPGEFLTDVRTPCPALWEHNPHVTPIDDLDPGAEAVDCAYPLVHRSNQEPWHFIHGFMQHLNYTLGTRIRPTAFQGDLHISGTEKSWYRQICEALGRELPYGLVSAGGKFDFTAKCGTPRATRRSSTASAAACSSSRWARRAIIIRRCAACSTCGARRSSASSSA
jgi:hypothetical protein